MERTLQILVEVCIDIAHYIISDQGMSVPVSYAYTFQVLKDHRVIGENLCQTMKKMVQFRNGVVHQYEKIDPTNGGFHPPKESERF